MDTPLMQSRIIQKDTEFVCIHDDRNVRRHAPSFSEGCLILHICASNMSAESLRRCLQVVFCMMYWRCGRDFAAHAGATLVALFNCVSRKVEAWLNSPPRCADLLIKSTGGSHLKHALTLRCFPCVTSQSQARPIKRTSAKEHSDGGFAVGGRRSSTPLDCGSFAVLHGPRMMLRTIP